jgi:hypothetical protein
LAVIFDTKITKEGKATKGAPEARQAVPAILKDMRARKARLRDLPFLRDLRVKTTDASRIPRAIR